MHCESLGRLPPQKLWSDEGLGGRAGSLWTVNNIKLVWATTGWSEPPGPFYELRDWPFNMREVAGGDGGVATVSGGDGGATERDRPS